MPSTTQTLDVSQLDKETARVVDTYRRVRGIYERTEMAMGRVPRYRITVASTATVIGNVNRRTS